MSDPDARFGMSTAWKRFQDEGAARPLAEHLEWLRGQVGLLNLEPDTVHLAAEIAALETGLEDDDRIALILLLLASLAAIQEGSTRLPLPAADGGGALERFLTPFCGPNGEASMAATLGRIDALLREGASPGVIGSSETDYKPLLHLGPYLYQQRSHFTETRLARRLAEFLRSAPEPLGDPEPALREVLEGGTFLRGAVFAFTADQKTAIREAFGSSLTIITGGPGTGKTSIVVAILRVLARLGVDPERVALAAPTGKAADRMRESFRAGLDGLSSRSAEEDAFHSLEPRTLHRLLGYQPRQNRFRHHSNNPLEQSFIVVDEGSMVDLELMDRLVAAIRPGTRLILLGDANQLPSVSAGAVFRDLLPEAWAGDGKSTLQAGAACVRLKHSFRMEVGDPAGRRIFLVSEAMNRGDELFDASTDGTALVALRERAEDLEWAGVESLEPGPRKVARFLDQWDSRCIGEESIALSGKVFRWSSAGFDPQASRELDALFERHARARILCVTRVLPTGSREINKALHARAARRAGRNPDRFPFLPGEPIMMLRNDYALSLWNGDQGIVLRVREEGSGEELRAIFRREEGYGAYHLEMLRENVELSYAMTVHKAQGSEFDEVGLILPDEDIPLLTREILYTALTRARRSVVVVGRSELLARGIARRIERSSGLSEKLRELLARDGTSPTPARSASRRPRRTSGSGS